VTVRIVPAPSRFRGRLAVSVAVLVAILVAGACDSFGARAVVVTNPPRPVMPRPSPTSTAHLAAIDSFVTKAATGTWSYRVAFSGFAAGSADHIPLTGRMDVSGSDFSGTMSFDFSKEYQGVGKLKVLVRGVQDKAWQNMRGAGWKAVSGYSAADSSALFTSVKTSADVRFLGTEKLDGATVHRISITKAVFLHPRTIPGQLTKEKIRSTTLEVLIDDEGLPVRGKWTLEGQGRVGPSGGQLQEIVFELTLAFSKVGAKLPIKRP
jgi:hypothetical protein